MNRCDWVSNDPLYINYHDTEWGKHKTTTEGLFEALTLELMQSGLSFLTVLKKRDAFRQTFYHYDLTKLAEATEKHISNWMTDASIIRHKTKLEAVVNNALVIKQIEKNQSFYDYLLKHIHFYIPHYTITDDRLDLETCTKIAKELKKDGFKFIGPTTLYSFFQAIGFVNDHAADCDFN